MKSTQPVERAITTYKASPQCQVVKKAVKKAFKDIFPRNIEQKLVQIALDNLLCRFFLSILYLSVILIIVLQPKTTLVQTNG